MKTFCYFRLSPIQKMFLKNYPQYSKKLSPVHHPVCFTSSISTILGLIFTRFCTDVFKRNLNRSVASLFCLMCINCENNDKYRLIGWEASDQNRLFQSSWCFRLVSWSRCILTCLKIIL